MIVLGLDPSITDFGWAVHNSAEPQGSTGRCVVRGRFRSDASMTYIDRYMSHRESLREVIRKYKPDRVGTEFPVFKAMFSEGAYGLFLFVSEALRTEQCDVVFWSPLQVKAHARELLSRPPNWKMDKVDMVEASKIDTGQPKWNHNESDAYHVARLSARFWELYDGKLSESDLTKTETQYFTEVKKYIRGKNAGKEVKSGVMYREDERFFLWSQKEDISGTKD